jgi:HAD superfamily hydrolase (TIGR01484 family)
MAAFLLCTDLDRTLLPNGAAPESSRARELFRRLSEREDMQLAYVSGRDRELVEEAIRHYQLPRPHWLIADVGASLYRRGSGEWLRSEAWDSVLDRCWRGATAHHLAAPLLTLEGLRLQEPARQGRHKLSFHHPLQADLQELRQGIETRLRQQGVAANLIFSVDERAAVGLLDVLPAVADKLRAIRFVIKQQGYDPNRSLFAGDSGNDLEILVSDIPSVIVANAQPELVEEAVQLSRRAGTATQLYVARGGFLGMNGNYAAGILEGLAHFHPDQVVGLS